MDCIFCKISQKEIPAEIVFENEDILAFKDVHPLAPVHVLVIPKKHVESVNDWKDKDAPLAGRMILVAQKIAKDLGIAENGYKLLFRTGRHGGQEVPHIHLHLIGGAELEEKIKVRGK